MSKKKTKAVIEGRTFFHYGVTDRGCRVTVAGLFNEGILKLGKAVCSPRDTFVKKTARLISTGRAFKSPINTIEITGAQIPGKVFAEIAVHLV